MGDERYVRYPYCTPRLVLNMAKHPTTSEATAIGTDNERIVSTEELLERIPIDRSTLWRMCRDGRFPRPIQLTPARHGWRWSAVLGWMKDREENPVEARAYFRRATKSRSSSSDR